MDHDDDPGRQAARIHFMSITPAIAPRLLVVLAVTALLAGCGSSNTSPSPSTAAPREVRVAISGYAYQPVNVTIAVGGRIRFTNNDPTAHTATSTVPAFDTGRIRSGHSATVTLTKPGIYQFYCQFHAFMRGGVTVG